MKENKTNFHFIYHRKANHDDIIATILDYYKQIYKGESFTNSGRKRYELALSPHVRK